MLQPRASRIAVLAFCFSSFTAVTSAAADQLAVNGQTLIGKVKAITTTGVEFQPDFAKSGSIVVPWDKVDDVRTEGSYQVLYGADGEADAPIQGYDDGKIEIGGVKVDPKEIVAATALGDDGLSFADRTRRSWRYWHGGAALGFNVQQSTTDTLGVLFTLHALRSQDRTRLILGADYRYATEDSKDDDEKRTKDAASGLVRGEYDITKSIFAYGSTDVLYDAVQNLSLRAVPKAGAGYVIYQQEPKEGIRNFVQVEAGAGWVYEKYMGDVDPDDDDYFTIAFGAAAGWLLPRGAMFDWRFDYLPAVTDWSDYVVRTAAGLSVPLIAPLSAKLSIGDTYDSTPAGDAEKNSLFVDTALGLDW